MLMTYPLPKHFQWLLDEQIPHWVKHHFSPHNSWKKKPFDQQDALFFLKGIHELSSLFQAERPERQLFAYFQHAKYRSSYFLYFMPLQMAKFCTLFEQHAQALHRSVQYGEKNGVLHVADIGAGPGTASLSFLLWLLEHYSQTSLPPIHLHWCDTQSIILEDGKKFLKQILSHFPKLQVQWSFYSDPWWKGIPQLPELSLAFMGHVLNERKNVPSSQTGTFTKKSLQKLLQKTQAGGLLLLEPATRQSFQTLSIMREGFTPQQLSKNPLFWGPCLHNQRCPLIGKKDWCHFSFPVQIPGQWFSFFSKSLSSERHWVKGTYLWIASLTEPPPQVPKNLRRIISDPIPNQHSSSSCLLLCEPLKPRRWTLFKKSTLYRGELLTINKQPSPLTAGNQKNPFRVASKLPKSSQKKRSIKKLKANLKK